MMNIKKWKEKDKISFKKKLKDYCIQIISEKVEEAMKSMERAQEAVNDEGKSAMGDKYEITKAMGQIDSDRAGLQLFEGKKQLSQLRLINVEKICTEATAGAFIICDTMNYFIATSIGNKIVEGEKISIISAMAPVAMLMKGKKEGDTFLINGLTIRIENIF